MKQLLDIAWILVKILSFGGLAVALAGVGVFGWNFVRQNAIAGQSEGDQVPPESWRGRGARMGLAILMAAPGCKLPPCCWRRFCRDGPDRKGPKPKLPVYVRHFEFRGVRREAAAISLRVAGRTRPCCSRYPHRSAQQMLWASPDRDGAA